MSQYPPPQQPYGPPAPYQQPYPQQTIIVQQAPTNGMGTTGFVLSLVGLLMCGCLCPIGALISLIALGKEPRGLAVAGLIIGILGTLLIFILFIPLVLLPIAAGLESGNY